MLRLHTFLITDASMYDSITNRPSQTYCGLVARSKIFDGAMELFGGARIVAAGHREAPKARALAGVWGSSPQKMLKNRRSLLASECIPGPQSEGHRQSTSIPI